MSPPSALRPPPSIAIVGASTRAAAASAIRAGLQPVAADLFADADLRSIATATRISPYPDGLIDWLRAIEPPAWMYTGALENHPGLVDEMAWIAPLWGNPGDVLDRIRSPLELARALCGAGLLFPETRTSSDRLPQDGTWLAKTHRGASGSGVRALIERGGHGEGERGRFDSNISTTEFPPLPLSPSPTLFFQQRISGTPCAAVFVAMDDASRLCGVTRQLIGLPWLGAHGFQYAGSIGMWPISQAAENTLTKIGDLLTKRFELCGLFGVDFMLDGDHVWTLEVNPRYTASVEIIERITGIQSISLHADACTDSSPAASRVVPDRAHVPTPAPAHGKAILFARHDLKISEAFAEMALAEALCKPWPTLADVSPAGTTIEAGRPILTLFANGSTVDDVEHGLRTRVEQLERHLYGNEVPS